ncbi:MAG: prolipoprotein diacylglyceryl transferase [Pedosphaera sp.]|nr:prolipoprotein diacylglyceryl transferase [Pedosphaera sp.]
MPGFCGAWWRLRKSLPAPGRFFNAEPDGRPPAFLLGFRTVRPVLFYLGTFPVRAFGVLVALGFVFGMWTAARRAVRVSINPEKILDLGPWVLGAGLLGARAMYVLNYWERDFSGRPWIEAFQIWNGGLVFYGGLLLAIPVAIWRVKAMGLPVWTVADCLAPSIALGHVFGRIGCFFNGCCFGQPTLQPWGVRFPSSSGVPGDGPVHPTQLYEAALNLVLFAVLSGWFYRRRFDGQIFAGYLLGYAVIRSLTEYFRGDYSHVSAPTLGVFTPGQWISFPILLCGVILYFCRRPARATSQTLAA